MKLGVRSDTGITNLEGIISLKFNNTRATYLRSFKDLKNPYIFSRLYTGEAFLFGGEEEGRLIEVYYDERFEGEGAVGGISMFIVKIIEGILVLDYRIKEEEEKRKLVLPLLKLKYLLLLDPIHPLRDYL